MSDALDRANDAVDRTNPAILAQHHSYVLRLEMNRRAIAQEKARRDSIVNDRQLKLKSAALETKSIENVVEVRDEREAMETARKQQGQLDEFGSMGWWRSSA
jgi:flagellar export protein FliJ